MLVKMYNMCKIIDGEYILVQNRTKNDWPGITFPGGKVEQDESIYDSCIREVKEETGLDVSDLCLKGIVHYKLLDKEERWVIYLYETHTFSGSLYKAPNEDEVFWTKESKLESKQLSDDLDVFLTLYKNEHVKEAYAYWDPKSTSQFTIY